MATAFQMVATSTQPRTERTRVWIAGGRTFSILANARVTPVCRVQIPLAVPVRRVKADSPAR